MLNCKISKNFIEYAPNWQMQRSIKVDWKDPKFKFFFFETFFSLTFSYLTYWHTLYFIPWTTRLIRHRFLDWTTSKIDVNFQEFVKFNQKFHNPSFQYTIEAFSYDELTSK